MKKGSFLKRSLEDRLFSDDSISEITPKTKVMYSAKFQTIKKHAKKLELDDNYSDLKETVKILIENDEISLSTAKIYRAVILYHIYEDALINLSRNEDIEYLKTIYDEISDWIIVDTTIKNNTSKNTSAYKTKYFDKAFYDYCLEQLSLKMNPIRNRKNEKNRDKFRMLYHFLVSNNSLGLRPIEWFSVAPSTYLSLINGVRKSTPTPSIIIENAKHTNGRANGETREILYSGFSEYQKESVNSLISLFRKYNHTSYDQNQILRILNDNLKLLCVSYVQDNPHLQEKLKADILNTTLYTTRHQAINNAKLSGYSKSKIAAMFGHVSTITQSKYYGQKGKGWLKLQAEPSLESIIAVGNTIGGSSQDKKNTKTNQTPNYGF